MLCLSYCETLGPMLPYLGVVSVIVAAVALAEVDQQGFAGGQRSTPHKIDRHGGVEQVGSTRGGPKGRVS